MDTGSEGHARVTDTPRLTQEVEGALGAASVVNLKLRVDQALKRYDLLLKNKLLVKK